VGSCDPHGRRCTPSEAGRSSPARRYSGISLDHGGPRRDPVGCAAPSGGERAAKRLHGSMFGYACGTRLVLGSAWVWLIGAGALVLRSETLRRRPLRSRRTIPRPITASGLQEREFWPAGRVFERAAGASAARGVWAGGR
jgi:hypothetical protein